MHDCIDDRLRQLHQAVNPHPKIMPSENLIDRCSYNMEEKSNIGGVGFVTCRQPGERRQQNKVDSDADHEDEDGDRSGCQGRRQGRLAERERTGFHWVVLSSWCRPRQMTMGLPFGRARLCRKTEVTVRRERLRQRDGGELNGASLTSSGDIKIYDGSRIVHSESSVIDLEGIGGLTNTSVTIIRLDGAI